jgi:uncharacterized membrane protein
MQFSINQSLFACMEKLYVFHVHVFHVRVFHVRVFHVRVFHVRVFHVRVFQTSLNITVTTRLSKHAYNHNKKNYD